MLSSSSKLLYCDLIVLMLIWTHPGPQHNVKNNVQCQEIIIVTLLLEMSRRETSISGPILMESDSHFIGKKHICKSQITHNYVDILIIGFCPEVGLMPFSNTRKKDTGRLFGTVWSVDWNGEVRLIISCLYICVKISASSIIFIYTPK